MTVAAGRRPLTAASDEADAFTRVVLGLTAAVGAMVAAIGAATGQPILIAALPTVVLLGALVGSNAAVAGWAGVAVWMVLVPSAQGEALIAPLAMIVLCLAIAVSPGQLLGWIGRDVLPKSPPAHASAAEGWIEGWIEEDTSRIG